MALPAADLWLFHILLGLLAVGADLDLEGEEWQRPFELWPEMHVLTGIRPQDPRHRTVIA